ncbi:uncharacterized protein EV422DRAFT_546284 [Fimicolochytrium jonesii]|uniref:uncharacterized protein n=1 Tax=Fimicolochytrium jonesii TaxID=1396493 RepID=UPI0022FE8A83|nr:uncharacterized protein EV422DRAFT_546284 [Fimicolochytrium jonesii]KAI8816323.1 hypothetical protein EV422DRAFT_546284 [Fimicolochytrium jonesii]
MPYHPKRRRRSLPQPPTGPLLAGKEPPSKMYLSLTRNQFLLVLLGLAAILTLSVDYSLASARQLHKRCCTPTDLNKLAALSAPQNLTITGSTLAPFLIPRVSGTANNAKVQQHIKAVFKELGWDIEEDTFTDTTPLGPKTFTNIIVTKNPSARRKLLLAAHFDSKYFPGQDFIGATDSAAPCAILVDVAKTLDPFMTASPDPSLTLQIVFFDGEEAFVEWSATDSLYGSRHLAEKWEATYVMGGGAPPSSGAAKVSPEGHATNILQTIDALILLDLLGSETDSSGGAVHIWNSQRPTTHLWDKLVSIQSALVKQGLVSPHLSGRVDAQGQGGYFMSGDLGLNVQIEDDHVPFLKRGVPIVHVIPQVFPRVWHTLADSSEAIVPEIVADYALIFRVFVAEYLGLVVP